jgi:uncharacterized membrane protein
MDWRSIVVLAHVLAAFWYVTGYVGTNLCTEMARRSTTDDECRAALMVSDRLDLWANRPGGTAVGLTGLLALWVFGYTLTSPWILASIVLFAGVVIFGIFFWERVAADVGIAARAMDWAGVRRELSTPRVFVTGRIENLVVLIIITLMVVRPG